MNKKQAEVGKTWLSPLVPLNDRTRHYLALRFRKARRVAGWCRSNVDAPRPPSKPVLAGEAETDEGEAQRIPYCRAYRVFNADQVEGLTKEFYIRPEPPRDLGTEADPELEACFARSGACFETSGAPRAFYDLRRDVIHMPPIATFHKAQGFHGTLAHETINWSGAETRLARFKRFHDCKAYAFEELVAENGACMLGAQIGVAPEFDQSAAHVEGWLQAMKDDKRTIFRAASEAQKAVDYLIGKTSRAAAIDQAAA